MTPVLVIAALALLTSFLCSLFEAALYAITPAEVELACQRGRFGAARMARLRDAVEESIAAILTVNTISNTLGATVCASLVARIYGVATAGAFAAAFTLAVLVLSELIPKSLGVRYAATIAPWIAWPLQGMIWVSWPVARASRWLMNLLTGGRGAMSAGVDEVLIITRMARRAGALRAQQHRWVENALKLDEVTAYDLMTPRTVVDSLPADLRLGDIAGTAGSWEHTRLPLIEGDNPDQVVGVVHGKDVFRAMLAGDGERRLRDLARPIHFVPDAMKGHQLLDHFITRNQHLVAVTDEYGGFEGIVTLEDVLECMLGREIVDEHDEHTDMQQVARLQAKEREDEIRREDEVRHGDAEATGT